jgi:hypothetical protein
MNVVELVQSWLRGVLNTTLNLMTQIIAQSRNSQGSSGAGVL